MLPSSVYTKTEVGAAELKVAHGALSGHERHLLILIDGRRTVAELAAVFGTQTVNHLLPLLEAHGYVHLVEAEPVLQAAEESSPVVEESGTVFEAVPAAVRSKSGLAAGMVVLVALGVGAWVLLQRHDDQAERPKTDLLNLDFASTISRPGASDGAVSTVMSPTPVRQPRAADTEEPQSPAPRERAVPRPQARGGDSKPAPQAQPPMSVVILPPEIARTSPQALAAAQPASASAGAASAPQAPEASAAARGSLPPAVGTDAGRTPRPVMVAAAADVSIPATATAGAASSKPLPVQAAAAGAATPAGTGLAPSVAAPAGSAAGSAPERPPAAEPAPAKPETKVAMIDPIRTDAAASGLRVRDRVVPPLPPRARRAGVDGGTVVARLHVTPDGSVERVDLVSAKPAQVYDESVRAALLKWVFDPPGRSAEMTVELDFRPP